MGSGKLHADARPTFGHDRVREPDDVDAVREQALRLAESRLNARAELLERVAALAEDADAYVADLRKALGDDSQDEPVKSLGKAMDGVTMWFLVGVGACLMGGLLTRIACVLAIAYAYACEKL